MRQKVVCFDTNIIVWGVKNEATEERRHCIPKAQYLIETLESERAKIIVPSVVVGEVLAGTQEQDVQRVLRSIQERFIVVPFNVLAAIKFAELFKKNRARRQIINRDAQDVVIKRSEFKVDQQIVATAVVHKADYIYTEDTGLMNFAEGYISVRGLPSLPSVQQVLDLDV